jgi:ABC-2 type transport system ATP-binding protein
MIEIRNLTKRYKNHGALKGLSLTVPEGSAFLIVGANGAGKTTMIKILMNLLEATSGTAEIFGVDSRRLSPKELERIGYVSENQELPGKLTVEEYLNYLRPSIRIGTSTWRRRRSGSFVCRGIEGSLNCRMGCA